MTRRFAALALALAAACAPAARAPEAEQMDGVVRLMGSAPMDVRVGLRGADGREVVVEGPAATELRALSGATVQVRGRGDGRTFQAVSYRVVSIDGEPAWVGVVERAPGGGLRLRLDDGSALALLGGAEGNLVPGQKVWVQGPGAVQVQAYGVISTP